MLILYVVLFRTSDRGHRYSLLEEMGGTPGFEYTALAVDVVNGYTIAYVGGSDGSVQQKIIQNVGRLTSLSEPVVV